jgi:hypothetical protein
MYHGKTDQIHKRNQTFPRFSLCGMERITDQNLTHRWERVNCGNCIALQQTSTVESIASPGTEQDRQLYVDSSQPSTVWERVEVWERDEMWPLSIRGTRLPLATAPTYAQVNATEGPLVRIQEIELLWRYVRHLETRIGDGNL